MVQRSVSAVEETGMFGYFKRLASTLVNFDESSESVGWHEVMEKSLQNWKVISQNANQINEWIDNFDYEKLRLNE